MFIVYSGSDAPSLYEKKSLSTAYELGLVSHRCAVRKEDFIVSFTRAQEVLPLEKKAHQTDPYYSR